jgi:uncharacterized damage-inducible protein DinB
MPMSAIDAKTVADFLLADFENETRTTLAVLGAVPGGRLDYRPDDKGKTGLGLLRHIALEDAWLLNGIADGAFAPQPDDSDACGIATPADAVARYERDVPAALGRVRAMSGEQLEASLNLLDMVTMPAVHFLAMTLKHSVHHRGQLSSYLRAMGGTMPSIYGPTADSH